jgi:hypothetical protein
VSGVRSSIVPKRGLTATELDPVAELKNPVIADNDGHARTEKMFSRRLTNPEHSSGHAQCSTRRHAAVRGAPLNALLPTNAPESRGFRRPTGRIR